VKSAPDAVNVKMPTPLFIAFKLKDAEKTMLSISWFCIHKALNSVAGLACGSIVC
jgi:hypothetical protein